VALEVLAQVGLASLLAQHLEVEVLLGVVVGWRKVLHLVTSEVLAQVVLASLPAQNLEEVVEVRLEEVAAG
jgi:hypothetical protein